jgi:hypothetical protein
VTKKLPSKDTTYERGNNILQGVLYVFETSKVSLLPNTPKNTNGYNLPNRRTPWPSSLPPTGKKVDNSTRHNPRHTKPRKNKIPQSGSHITVKKKVVHKFSISLAQVAHKEQNPTKNSFRRCKLNTFFKNPWKRTVI